MKGDRVHNAISPILLAGLVCTAAACDVPYVDKDLFHTEEGVVSDADAGTVADTDTVTGTVTDTVTDTGSDTVTVTDTGADTVTDTGADTVTDTGADTVTDKDGGLDAADAPDAATGTTTYCSADNECAALGKGDCVQGLCKAGTCVADIVADGKICDDGDKCTDKDACKAGKCVPGNGVSCDDGNKCTTNGCEPAKGCTATAKVGACDNGDLCTEGDTCKAKVCVAGSKVTCKDDDPCTLNPSCDPKKGCIFDPAKDGTACGNFKVCATGKCVPDCAALADGTACDDGNVCTTKEVCKDQKCVSPGGAEVETLAGGQGYIDGGPGVGRLAGPSGLVVSGAGIVYVADTAGHTIRRITPDGTITTVAGSGIAGYSQGTGKMVRFTRPAGVDLGPKGLIWVADSGNNRIRTIDGDGKVITLAGLGKGYKDGKGLNAWFSNPTAIQVAPAGHAYIADRDNYRIRKRAADGQVTSHAGSSKGFADGQGAKAKFGAIHHIALAANGFIYVADEGNSRIRRVDGSGTVITVAGGKPGYADDKGEVARFKGVSGITPGPTDVVFVADTGNHVLRRIAGDGTVTTIAGLPTVAGALDGGAAKASFNGPMAVAAGPGGILYIADTGNAKVRRFVPPGNSCEDKSACTLDSCDGGSGCLHKPVAAGLPCEDGTLCTVNDLCDAKGACKPGGKPSCVPPDLCSTNICDPKKGCQYAAQPEGAACSKSGACKSGLCVVPDCTGQAPGMACDDGDACTLGETCAGGKCVAATGAMVHTWAGASAGMLEGKGVGASFNGPMDVVVDSKGVAFVVERYAHRIRRIDTDGTVTTLAGWPVEGNVDAKGKKARFYQPHHADLAPLGDLLVTDGLNRTIRKVAMDGTVTTIAGNGKAAHVNGTGTAASFLSPKGIAIAKDGTSYIADAGHRIRKMTAGGVVSTVAGTGKAGSADGQGTQASFSSPWGVAVDAQGHVFVADSGNHRIRRISPTGGGHHGGGRRHVGLPGRRARAGGLQTTLRHRRRPRRHALHRRADAHPHDRRRGRGHRSRHGSAWRHRRTGRQGGHGLGDRPAHRRGWRAHFCRPQRPPHP